MIPQEMEGKKLTNIAVNDPLDLSSYGYNFTTEHYDQTEAELDVTSLFQ